MSTEEINHLKAIKTYQQIPFQRFFSSTEWLDGSVNPSGFKTFIFSAYKYDQYFLCIPHQMIGWLCQPFRFHPVVLILINTSHAYMS